VATRTPYVVALDPGHGGSPSSDPAVLWDPGVIAGSLVEKDITLDLAFRLRALLEQERVKVVMTRTSDRYLEISERWALAHRSGARLFVSLHVNAFEGDPSIQGFTVFYPRADSQPLATHLESGLAAALRPFGVADDGVAVKPDLWVHSDVPTATVEPAYLTNAREAGLLRRADFREAIASGIHQGLLDADPQIMATYQEVLQAERAQAARRRADEAAAARVRQWQLAGFGLAAVGLTLIGLRARRTMIAPVGRRRRRSRGRRRTPARRPGHQPVRDFSEIKK
jgi:N-acetylmuramoyl-L-alanine amidase